MASQYLTDQDRIDQLTMKISNPNIVGSGFIQFPPQKPFQQPLLFQPPTTAHLEFPDEYKGFAPPVAPTPAGAPRPGAPGSASLARPAPQANPSLVLQQQGRPAGPPGARPLGGSGFTAGPQGGRGSPQGGNAPPHQNGPANGGLAARPGIPPQIRPQGPPAQHVAITQAAQQNSRQQVPVGTPQQHQNHQHQQQHPPPQQQHCQQDAPGSQAGNWGPVPQGAHRSPVQQTAPAVPTANGVHRPSATTPRAPIPAARPAQPPAQAAVPATHGPVAGTAARAPASAAAVRNPIAQTQQAAAPQAQPRPRQPPGPAQQASLPPPPLPAPAAAAKDGSEDGDDKCGMSRAQKMRLRKKLREKALA